MITMKDVIREGNPILREKAVEVKLPLSTEDENTLRDMIDYIYASVDPVNEGKEEFRPAVGIAAPQIGVSKKMIAIVAPDENFVDHEFILVNPKILSYSDELTYLEGGEGCLSVDRPYPALIHRPKRVTFSSYFYDYDSRELVFKTVKLKGYLAVVFQHEYDHLNGILFVDKGNKENPNFIPENSTPVRFNQPKNEKN